MAIYLLFDNVSVPIGIPRSDRDVVQSLFVRNPNSKPDPKH